MTNLKLSTEMGANNNVVLKWVCTVCDETFERPDLTVDEQIELANKWIEEHGIHADPKKN